MDLNRGTDGGLIVWAETGQRSPHNSAAAASVVWTVSPLITQNRITDIKKNHVWKDSISILKSLARVA